MSQKPPNVDMRHDFFHIILISSQVKLIARSMDSVEQEFEVRDANIRRLEGQVSKSKSAMATLEDKLAVANDVIASQNADLAEAVAAQKAAVREYEVAETEANELHEFLQVYHFIEVVD